ncbi:MAG: hypothetical protein ACR2IP_11420 [Solirubrobacteraceae bacterium]
MHGGSAGQVRAAAERRVQTAEAWAAVQRLMAERERALAERPPRRSWAHRAADMLEGDVAPK